MTSTIITIVIAIAFSLLFKRKYIICVFGLSTLCLIVPVRWIVFPVSQYLATMSASQIFEDSWFVISQSFANAFRTFGSGEVDPALAVIGFIGIGAALNLVGIGFASIKNQETEKSK